MKAYVTLLAAAVALPLFAEEDAWTKNKAKKLKSLTDEQKGLIVEALPAATAEPKEERRILVFYRCEGFVHGSITAGNEALQRMGEKSGAFTADLADTYDVFSAENLAKYDAIVFNNTTHLKFEDPGHRSAVMAFMKAGKGIAGLHAASDNFYDWDDAAKLIGGQFNGHPWTAGDTWAFQLDDPSHTLNTAFDGKGFWHKDEIYQYKPDTFEGEENLRILVSLDMSKDEVKSRLTHKKSEKFNKVYEAGKDRSVPVSWLREFGGGRVFYSNFGHNPDTFWNPAMLQHFLDGIQYAVGDLDAEATPSATAASSDPALAPAKE